MTASVDRVDSERCRDHWPHRRPLAAMWWGKGCCCTHVHNIPLRTVRDAPPRAAAALPARRGGHPASTRWDTPHQCGGSQAGDALACRAHWRSSISRDVAAGAAAGADSASAHATRCHRGAPLRDSKHCCFVVRGAGASGTSGDGSSGSSGASGEGPCGIKGEGSSGTSAWARGAGASGTSGDGSSGSSGAGGEGPSGTSA